ncbi:MAG: peptide chain release factor N(5)-glutamine methyltransferase [Bacteroidaceae bacterium]|nr:peptide chain release factor N(5)-glutamine methyltransferase [Bacteroidaceae bacterium]
MMNLYREIKNILTEGGMPDGEAKAIALMLLERVLGLPTAKALIADGKSMLCRRQNILGLAARISQGEPVQYVLGETDFCNLTLKVKPGILIPRPETEELVHWIVENVNPSTPTSQQILDIGTGSGCIAIALAKKLEHAEVEAWDISDVAIEVAKENAERNHVQLKIRKVDVLSPLNPQLSTLNPYDLIVSNPPYVCEEEAQEMERNVLEHEPKLALFVPDNDPLLFYRQIGALGQQILKPQGRLFFEINRRFGQEVLNLLKGMGYSEVELRQDTWGNDRMIKAIKPL